MAKHPFTLFSPSSVLFSLSSTTPTVFPSRVQLVCEAASPVPHKHSSVLMQIIRCLLPAPSYLPASERPESLKPSQPEHVSSDQRQRRDTAWFQQVDFKGRNKISVASFHEHGTDTAQQRAIKRVRVCVAW